MADNNNNNGNGNGKKGLKKKSISSSSVLVQLYNNRKVVTKVDNMLDEGKSYDYIIAFCNENGVSISKASLTNYKKKREEAIETGTPLIQLLDKRAKDNVTYITDKEIDRFKKTRDKNKDVPKEPSSENTDTNLTKAENVYNDVEFLEEVINKGFKGLKQFHVVDIPLAMKAVELKAKLTNNQLNGLSIAGLRELKLRQQARESALMEVIMQYVPEDKQEQLFEDMDAAEQRFYENLDLTEEDRRLSKALGDSGIDL